MSRLFVKPVRVKLQIPKKTNTTMSQDKLVKIKCTETGDVLYTRKNKKGVERKLELKKFNTKLKKRTVYKESKK